MKNMRFLLVVIALAAAKPADLVRKKVVPEILTWEEWKTGFKDIVDAPLKDHEEESRKEIFQQNVELMKAHNAKADLGEVTYRLGVNQFSHMTQKEWAGIYLRPMNFTKPERTKFLKEGTAPPTVDWRTKGAVTKIKNQGQCGSCWAFSTTGSTESSNFIANGKLVSLSEQQLMDCSKAEGNQSCQGGLMDNAFKYIIANHGIDTEADYPYEMKNEACNSAKQSDHVVTITGYTDVPHESGAQLELAVAKQPVSIAIEADQSYFQHYRSGVFQGPCGHNLDHGVLIVGYTAQYWIVKNSWGTVWGDQGYIQIARNLDAPYGLCGILMQPSYPKSGTPGPTSPPTAPGPSPALPYYEDPYLGPCHSGELNITVNGLTGAFCAPSCPSGSCPPAPSAFTGATGECILSDSANGQKYCALVCSASQKTSCIPGLQSTCKPIQGTGLCTWNDVPPTPTTRPTNPTPPHPTMKPTVPGSAYENPFIGPCSAGEANLTLPSASGAICAPNCSKSACPTALPKGFDANTSPLCFWEDPFTEEKFCTLECDPSDSTSCNHSMSATCKSVGNVFNRTVGICTYDNKRNDLLTTLFTL